MRKLIQILPFITIVSLSIVFLVKVYFGYDPGRGSSPEDKMAGRVVPGFDLEDVVNDDSRLSDEDFKDAVVVLNFFSSWCTTCRMENPILLEASKVEGLKIFGVAWRDKKNDTLTWLSDIGNPYDKVGYDDIGKVGISFGIRGIPETFVINDGVIIRHYVGNLPEEFSRELEKVKNEKKLEKYKQSHDS